ncbi:MAG TPA: hypothetical protein ENG35_01910, partial [Desulfobacteraceae bacterium]|nr:hypothetical protein [Desulfobacteraceae bacterium]
METYCDDPDKKEQSLNLITHVKVEPSHNSDANALIPAIESTEEQNPKPKEILADSLYGSDDNCERAKKDNAGLTAPTMGSVKEDKLSFTDFIFSPKGEPAACPRGKLPAKIKKKKRLSIGFALQDCENCPD